MIRARLDEYYKELTLLAQSYSVVQPTEKSAAFIRNLNQLIAETTAAYNQRLADHHRHTIEQVFLTRGLKPHQAQVGHGLQGDLFLRIVLRHIH